MQCPRFRIWSAGFTAYGLGSKVVRVFSAQVGVNALLGTISPVAFVNAIAIAIQNRNRNRVRNRICNIFYVPGIRHTGS